uniref:Ribosomal RNA-processing protein 8 n=1 Tax=Naja naja TaxID=35670 RepID=A0A8C6XAY9_NAJNA
MSRCPWLAARCKGVSSPRFMTLMRAPRMTNMSTTLERPSRQAQCRGLKPWSSLPGREEAREGSGGGRQRPVSPSSAAWAGSASRRPLKGDQSGTGRRSGRLRLPLGRGSRGQPSGPASTDQRPGPAQGPSSQRTAGGAPPPPPPPGSPLPRPPLTRKQWRNRQKNKRRQKNKFKASHGRLLASSAADDLPHEQGGPTQDSEVPGRQTPSLRQRLESRLEAARFRYINQLLYTRSSQEAAQLFQEDPEALGVYHRGFALQAARWPQRPVERFVHYLHRRPASLVVADFGCGDCTLARSLPNRVHCFDLAALDPRVTVCDMAQVGQTPSVDVAVFCLALMGTNLREILQEAHRVLWPSRFADLRAFLGALARLGFRLTSKDVSGSHFYTFELRKTDLTEAAKAAEEPRGLALRPCLYKRR